MDVGVPAAGSLMAYRVISRSKRSSRVPSSTTAWKPSSGCFAFWDQHQGVGPDVRRDYNTGTMRFFGSRSFARSAPLVALAVLLCIGFFVPWLGDEPEAPDFLSGAHYSQVDQGTNGGAHLPTGSYLAAIGEEAKESDKGPVNAGLLTALLVVVGALVGWLLSNDSGTEAFRSSSITRWPAFVTTREAAPFLGVFRL